MTKKICSTGLSWLWVAVLVLIVDHITKYLIQKYFVLYSIIPITEFFNFTLAYNKGAAFSFLDQFSGWQTWLLGGISVIVSVGILFWLTRISSKQQWLGIALALVLGGALGNLSDRLLYGHVIDFLDFHLGHWHWPTFNIADSAICVGAFMLFIDGLFFSKK